jgi:hypothetical protein
VRIHSGIVSSGRATWSKLWYLLRALDIQGSGFCQVSLAQVSQLLRASSSTIRQWLREGKQIGAFRWWKFSQKQGLRVALGSIYKVCLGLGLNSWGVVAEIPLDQMISCLRATATAAVSQREQQLSRFAAWRNLPASARKVYKLPQPEAFFDGSHRPSDNLPRGGIRCLIHIGQHRIFTSKGFIPFGVSQPTIGKERRLTDRTVRRHLGQLGIEKRQIVQAKSAYREIREALRWDSPGIAPEPDISMRRIGQAVILTEPSGHVGKPHSTAIRAERLFSYGDRNYIYRCNLYRPALKLCSTKRSIVNYKRLLEKGPCRTLGTVLQTFPIQADKAGQNP